MSPTGGNPGNVGCTDTEDVSKNIEVYSIHSTSDEEEPNNNDRIDGNECVTPPFVRCTLNDLPHQINLGGPAHCAQTTKTSNDTPKATKSSSRLKKPSRMPPTANEGHAGSNGETTDLDDTNPPKKRSRLKKQKKTNQSEQCSGSAAAANGKVGQNNPDQLLRSKKESAICNNLDVAKAQNDQMQHVMQGPAKRKRKPAIKSHEGEAKISSKESKTDLAQVSHTKPSSAPKKSKPGNAKDSSSASAPQASQPSSKRRKLTYQDQVVRKMFNSCKPYNLKGLSKATCSTSESSLEFTLMSLLDKNLIYKKEFPSGKRVTTKVLYWANLDMSDHKDAAKALGNLCTPEELSAAQEMLRSRAKQQSMIEHDTAKLSNEPTNEQLDEMIRESETAVQGLQERILQAKEFRAQRQRSGNKNSKELGPQAKRLLLIAQRSEWKNRKEKCMDFVENMADALEKKVKDVVKVLDLETDEMMGVKMPPKNKW